MLFASKFRVSWWAIACFCSLVSPLTASTLSIIDNENDNVESIAKVVCETTKGTAHQLGRISTIEKLVRFLESALEDNKVFYKCRNKYLESLVELNYLFTTANEDVCSDEKLNLIERYHRRFVSKIVDGPVPKAPKVANLLFLQYAKRVSLICEQQAVKVLKQSWTEIKPEEQEKLEKMRQITDALHMSDVTQGYSGIYLFWNMVDSLPLDRSKKIAGYLAKRGETRVNVQMRNIKPIQGLQAICRYELSPVYSQSILPVLRLVDLGYYPESTQLIDGIKRDQFTTNMFIQTQVCEALRRVKVFADDTLEDDKFVAITLDEAAKLPAPAKLPDLDKIIEDAEKPGFESSSLVGVDQLLDSRETQQGIEEIKSTVKSRSKVMNRVLNTFITNLRGKLKSKVGGLYLGGNNSSPQNLQQALDNSLEGVDEIKAFKEDGDNEAGDEENGLVRRRRGIKKTLISAGKIISTVLIGVSYIIYFIAMMYIKVALLIVPSIIGLLLIGFGRGYEHRDFLRGLGKLWYWDPVRDRIFRDDRKVFYK